MARRRDNSVSATDAQNNFGAVLSRVAREGRVFITKYHQPEAVLLSMDAYRALAGEQPVDLDALERRFDDLVARMQTDAHRAGVDALFRMSAEELAQAARDAAER